MPVHLVIANSVKFYYLHLTEEETKTLRSQVITQVYKASERRSQDLSPVCLTSCPLDCTAQMSVTSMSLFLFSGARKIILPMWQALTCQGQQDSQHQLLLGALCLSPFSLRSKRQSLYAKALWGGGVNPRAATVRGRGSEAEKEQSKHKVVHF